MKHPSWLQVLLLLWLLHSFHLIASGQENNLSEEGQNLPSSTDMLSPCPKFEDAPNRDEIETSFVIYRDMLKAKNGKQAFVYWKKVHATAPAADGRRATIYLDGIRLYQQFYKLSQDSLEQEQYIDRIFELYDEMEVCYPKSESIPARKAFDLYQKYPHRATKEEIFQLCKEVLNRESVSMPAYIMLPATKLLVYLIQSRKIDFDEARLYVTKIQSVCSIKIQNSNKRIQGENWTILAQKVSEKLKALEEVKGFYDCGYFLEKYYVPILDRMSMDCDQISTAYRVFRQVGCLDLEQKKFLSGRLKSDCCAFGLKFQDWYR